MKTITIEGKAREAIGKKNAKLIRREQLVPCVLYGGDKNLHFSANSKEFKTLIYTPEFYKVNLSVDGGTYDAIVKDVQFHPVKDNITHVDFLELKEGRSFTTEIPVKLEGTSPGVKEGGKIAVKVRKLSVKCTPDSLVESIPVDISQLVLGKSVRVGDVKIDGVEILNSPGIPVVSCEIPRALKGGKGEGEEGAEGEEGEETATAEGEEAAAEKKD